MPNFIYNFMNLVSFKYYFIVVLLVHIYQVCASNYGLLKVESNSKLGIPALVGEFCVGTNGVTLRKQATAADQVPLTDIYPDVLCNNSRDSLFGGNYVLLGRGNCSFLEKGQAVKDAGGSAAIVVNFQNSTHLSIAADGIDIPVVMLSYDDYMSITNHTTGSLTGLLYLERNELGKAVTALAILLIGVLTLICVGVLAGSQLGLQIRRMKDAATADKARLNRSSNASSFLAIDDEELTLKSTLIAALIAISLLSTVLVLLFFFYDYLAIPVIIGFCLGSAFAFYKVFIKLIAKLPFLKPSFVVGAANCCTTNCPRCSKYLPDRISMGQILLTLVSLALATLFFIYRHTTWSFILQDLLCIVVVIYIFNTSAYVCLVPFKVVTIFSWALFFYDIFMVYITPYFTKDHKSVMETVAVGKKETIPLILRMPSLLPAKINEICFESQQSLLGLGDVIVPGITVFYNSVFDYATLVPYHIYFVISIIGWMAGFCAAMGVVIVFQTGQPALLYLIPIMNLSTLLCALIRGELKSFWSGEFYKRPQKNSKNATSPAERARASTPPLSSAPAVVTSDSEGELGTDDDDQVASVEASLSTASPRIHGPIPAAAAAPGFVPGPNVNSNAAYDYNGGHQTVTTAGGDAVAMTVAAADQSDSDLSESLEETDKLLTDHSDHRHYRRQ